ncbi:hypothetical protein B1R32_108141 [Abditibacterium utsteinense]|uniref:DUF4261 domain-containing protein n=1 Tax=Abditibacterium utsteinense TaxID=1960156 RepID=A0A2S8SSZ7_9BACT|nr:hypothetical protein [Abditibacterium utsteinense]PQV63930.1 hypothetical protein B1R32_108141 [Abditibacterium utsteinense]
MINGISSWPRPRFVAGGGDALVAFEVCGDFSEKIEVDFKVEGVEIRVEPNEFSRFGEVGSEMLRQSNLEMASAIEAAPLSVSIRGVVPDPQNLDYLRDCLHFIETLLENGGIGVIDPQTLQMFSPAQFRFIFCGNAFEPTSHATILLSMQGEIIWLHTRGMRIFGRPDLSCHGVKPEEVEKLQPVFNGLIRMQAAGALIPDGQIVQAIGIENRLICRPRGSLSDAEFNNFHLELEWETPRE